MFRSRLLRYFNYLILFGAGFSLSILILSSLLPSQIPLSYFRHEDTMDTSLRNKCAEMKSKLEKKKFVDDVKVLCWIPTDPDYYEKRSIMVKKTWGRRCNNLLFMSSENDTNPEVIALPNVVQGHEFLWGKTKEALKYIWENHRDDADWFMKADDDTFVLVENLRLLLHDKNTNDPIYFGLRWAFHFPTHDSRTFMYGGAGYVISREALRRFVEEAIPDWEKCRVNNQSGEDMELAVCMANVGVEFGDSRDSFGRHRFLPDTPEKQLNEVRNESLWYWLHLYYPDHQGFECCSNRAISFHRITPNEMLTLEYLLYHLRPFGIPK